MESAIRAALERLRTGFLGEQHREVLGDVLVAIDDAITLGEPLSPAIGVAYRNAVRVLGTAPAVGGAE